MNSELYCNSWIDFIVVATGSGQSCKSYESVELDGVEGYIGNVVTEGTGYGTSFCPWKIKLAPGQRINITLYDFGVLRYNKESPLCQVKLTPFVIVS